LTPLQLLYIRKPYKLDNLLLSLPTSLLPMLLPFTFKLSVCQILVPFLLPLTQEQKIQ